MKKLPKIIFLRHSPILFIPILGTFLYALQKYLYLKGFTKCIYLSRKTNKFKDYLLETLSKDNSIFICQTYKLGVILKKIDQKIISDFSAPKNFEKLPINKLHEISWTLILSDSLTTRTKKSLNEFESQTIKEGKSKWSKEEKEHYNKLNSFLKKLIKNPEDNILLSSGGVPVKEVKIHDNVAVLRPGEAAMSGNFHFCSAVVARRGDEIFLMHIFLLPQLD